jgi:hypothetical protein
MYLASYSHCLDSAGLSLNSVVTDLSRRFTLAMRGVMDRTFSGHRQPQPSSRLLKASGCDFVVDVVAAAQVFEIAECPSLT